MKKIAAATTAIALFLGVALVIAFQVPSVRIAYHRYYMEKGYNDTFGTEPESFGGGLGGYELGAAYDMYEEHRDALVDLGAVDKLIYRFENLAPGSDEQLHFWKRLLYEETPAVIDFVGTYKQTPYEITVWCYPENTKEWHSFLNSNDISDYKDQYIESQVTKR